MANLLCRNLMEVRSFSVSELRSSVLDSWQRSRAERGKMLQFFVAVW